MARARVAQWLGCPEPERPWELLLAPRPPLGANEPPPLLGGRRGRRCRSRLRPLRTCPPPVARPARSPRRRPPRPTAGTASRAAPRPDAASAGARPDRGALDERRR